MPIPILILLQKSIDNTSTNTFTGNTFFLLIQQSQVRLRGGPIWLRFFSFVGLVVNFNSGLDFACHTFSTSS